MIIAADLSKRFDDFWAVDGIGLEVAAGEVLALLGPNGAGKTTTVRMLSSVLRPTRGRAQVAGYDIVSEAHQVRASVGVLTEQHGLYARMAAEKYLHFFGQLYNLAEGEQRRRIEKLMGDFGLHADRKRRIGEYSKGMRQKLALARALLHDPPVLLLDEPTSAMDPESARLVRDSLRALRSAKRAIIVCTHNLAEAEELADKIAIIRKGKIIAVGSPEGLKRDLLGPPEYEIRLGKAINGASLDLPTGVQLTGQGSDWFRFQTRQPEKANPQVLKAILARGLIPITLNEVARSLEDVYLRAVRVEEAQEVAGG